MKQEIIHEIVLTSFCFLFMAFAFLATSALKKEQIINEEYNKRIIKFLQEINTTNSIIQTPEEFMAAQFHPIGGSQ